MSKLSEPLPTQVSQVISEKFTTPPTDADLTTYNDDFIKAHTDSTSHLQSGYNVRYILDNSSKAQNEEDLKNTLDLPDNTIEQALAGSALLSEWKSEKKIKEDYRAKAASRWSEATVFQQG